MITLELFGNPIPKQRARTVRRGSKSITYDPQDATKKQFQWQLKSQFRAQPLKIPLALDFVFFMPVCKSTSKIKRTQMINGVLAHTKKPDLDNLEKFILDCMNKIVFDDDAQVCEVRKKKIYSDKPGTLIRIHALANEKDGLLYENCARENR